MELSQSRTPYPSISSNMAAPSPFDFALRSIQPPYSHKKVHFTGSLANWLPAGGIPGDRGRRKPAASNTIYKAPTPSDRRHICDPPSTGPTHSGPALPGHRSSWAPKNGLFSLSLHLDGGTGFLLLVTVSPSHLASQQSSLLHSLCLKYLE